MHCAPPLPAKDSLPYSQHVSLNADHDASCLRTGLTGLASFTRNNICAWAPRCWVVHTVAKHTVSPCFNRPALAAGALVTLEPLPFANAEGPLKVLASGPSPAGHTGPAGHLGEAQAPAAQTGSHAHSPLKGTAAPGCTLCLPVNLT